MNLTWKTVFKVFRQCLGERTFSPVAGHCFYTELFRLDIGAEFWTRLWYYLDINAVPCSIKGGVHCSISHGLSGVDWSYKGFWVLWGS